MTELAQKFGRLTFIGDITKSKGLYKCDCGNTKILLKNTVIKGNRTGCGCLKHISLTGKKIGKLLILDSFYDKKILKYNCRCDCGNLTIVRLGGLQKGTSSCGCIKYTTNLISLTSVLWHEYKTQARRKKRIWELSEDEFIELITQPCAYCGQILPRDMTLGRKGRVSVCLSGIDRIDNNIGYVRSNCISCCKDCNMAKFTKTESEFFYWITTLAKNLYKCEIYKFEKEDICITKKQYGSWYLYKWHAKNRNLEWKLSMSVFSTMTSKNCFYCGQLDWVNKSVGIDRINNEKGYYIDNCVPCCYWCNYAKHIKDLDEFRTWTKTTYEYLTSNSKSYALWLKGEILK